MTAALCRLCAQSTESMSVISIFARNRKELLERIKLLTGLELKNEHPLPQTMCTRCTKELDQAYNFRQRCQEAQAYFDSSAYVHTQSEGEASYPLEALEISLKDEPIEEYLLPEHEINTEVVMLKCEEETNTKQHKIEELQECDALLSEDELHSDNDNRQEEQEEGEEEDEEQPESSDEEFELVAKQKKSKIAQRKTAKTNTKSSAKTMGQRITIERKKRKREERQSEFICDQCGNHFKHYNHFQMHLKRHTGEKSHQCEICANKFFTHSELTRHMRRHTGERPFACQYCQRRFTDYSTRVKHERTHTNERPFACTHCGKAFTTSYILKNHMLVHTGERSFLCTYCNKSFQRQTNLLTHYRSLMHKQNVEKHETGGSGTMQEKTTGVI